MSHGFDPRNSEPQFVETRQDVEKGTSQNAVQGRSNVLLEFSQTGRQVRQADRLTAIHEEKDGTTKGDQEDQTCLQSLKGNRGRQALLIFSMLALVQLTLVTALLAMGVKGKEYIGEGSGKGVPYYIGAMVTGAVFLTSIVFLLLLIFATRGDDDNCTICVIMCGTFLLPILGILAVVAGMVIVILCGIVDCKLDENNTNSLCSYNTNIDTNYNTATALLVLILLLLLMDVFNIYLLCAWNDDLVNRNVTSPEISPVTNWPHERGSGQTSSWNKSATGGPKKPKNSTQKKMIEIRERNKDYNRQRRLGVPEHRLIRKYFK